MNYWWKFKPLVATTLNGETKFDLRPPEVRWEETGEWVLADGQDGEPVAQEST